MRLAAVSGLLLALTATIGCTSAPSDTSGDPNKNDQASEDDIIVDGQPIPRLAPPPLVLSSTPAGSSDADKMLTFTANFGVRAKDAMTGELIDNLIDYRGQDFANEVFKGDYKTGLSKNGSPIQIGEVAYFRPGLGGGMFSPAQIFLAAQHFKYVVLLYSNITETDPNWPTALRKIDAVKEGILDPVEYVWKAADEPDITKKLQIATIKASAPLDNIYAIGSAHGTLITYMQQSDATLMQLEALRQANEDPNTNDPAGLNPNKVSFPFDPLDVLEDGGKAYVFAHSQGSPDSVLSNHRLQTAGIVDDGYADLAAVAGALNGCRIGGPNPEMNPWLGSADKARMNSGAGEHGADAFLALVPVTFFENVGGVILDDVPTDGDALEDAVNKDIPGRVAYAFSAAVQKSAGVYPELAEKGDVRNKYFTAGSLVDFHNRDGKTFDNDGLVNNDASGLGQKKTTFYLTDHLGIIENPRLLLRELQIIAGLPETP